ncbi:MAG TPA: glycosyltransferase [Bryobacteraceae bacterium]|nr:glycosyltransferase [Bryobacteraceae bacterium]
MRVLLISVRADHGGGPEHIARLIEAAPADVQFTVACPRDLPYWGRYVQLLGSDNLIEIPHRAFRLGPLLRLAAAVRACGVQVIHSHGKGAGIYGRALRVLTGLPVVHTFHGLHTGSYGRCGRVVYIAFERLLGYLTSCTIAVSDGEGEQLRRAGLGKHLRVIVNGVRIPAMPTQEPVGPPYHVVMMTRYDYQKRAEMVVDIAEALHARGVLDQFIFELLGTGPGRGALAAALPARGLADAVRVFGAVDDSGSYLRGAFAYLSTSRWEGMPLAVLEAMGHGVPVVATDVVGNRDAVTEGGTGFLYEESAPEAAADALLALARNPGLWSRTSQAARSTALKWYSADRMSHETVACYRALLKQDARSAGPSLVGCGSP